MISLCSIAKSPVEKRTTLYCFIQGTFRNMQTSHKSPQDNQGMTPLHFAAEHGHLEVCKFLMENISEKNPRDNFGDTPLGLAKKNRHFKTACFITKYLANQKFQANQNLTAMLGYMLNYYLHVFKNIHRIA